MSNNTRTKEVVEPITMISSGKTMNHRRRKKVGGGVSFIFFILCVMGAALIFMAAIISLSRQNRSPTENRQPLQTISLVSPENMLLGRLAAIEERHRSVTKALSDLREGLEPASSTSEFAWQTNNMPHQSSPPLPPPPPPPPPPPQLSLPGPQPSPFIKVFHHRQLPMTASLPETRTANSERNSTLEDNRRASYASRAGGQVLPCSLNATIRVNRDLASNLGAHWYNHATKKCGLSAISHKMEPGCDGPGNQRRSRPRTGPRGGSTAFWNSLRLGDVQSVRRACAPRRSGTRWRC